LLAAVIILRSCLIRARSHGSADRHRCSDCTGVALTVLISNVSRCRTRRSSPRDRPGVGIDYALFIVTRYREGLQVRGHGAGRRDRAAADTLVARCSRARP
jgi:hypothetical protein